jgi:hypothetical protein
MAAINKIADGFVDASVLQTKTGISRKLMESDLEKSGLSADDLYAEPRALPSIFCPRGDLVVGCYRIPYFDSKGEVMEHMWRERVFYKEGAPKDLPKYVQPNGEYLIQKDILRCMPYLYPHGKDSSYVFITEGEKKAVKCADQFGVRCIGIGGKDMWHAPDIHPRILHPEIIKALDAASASTIVVVADPDINEKADVKKSYAGLLLRLQTQYADRTVRILAPPEKVDDWLAEETDIELDELLALEDIEGMESALSMADLVTHYELIPTTRATKDGDLIITGVMANEWNVVRLLEKHPSYAGSLRFNDDTTKLEVFGQPIQNNLHDTAILCAIQKNFHIPKLSGRVCASAIKHVSVKHGYSPAVDDIMACVDAGGDDIEWFEHVFPKSLVDIMRALVCGYVKRVLTPGCDWRIMIILAGPQKVGKTGCARWVTGDKERVYDFHAGQLDGKDKDIMKRLMRPGIALFDDIDTFGRTEKGRLKAIITQQHTTMRGAYKEYDDTFLRRGVMMGTTNDPSIIPDDPTGNTRFAVGLVEKLLPFEAMLKHRREIISCAYDLVKDGYNAEEIDLVGMTERFTEKSSITESLEEFVASLIDGTFKPNGVDIFVSGTGRLLFKSSRYWQHVTGRADYRPKDYERKELGLRARAAGLRYHDSNDSVLVKGVKVKNVWEVGSD